MLELHLDANSRTMNAISVPALAMNQNVFCQRNVVFVPAIRIAVIHRIITKPPRKIQPLSVWMWVPAVISAWLWKIVPSVTRTGPSAKTGK